MAKKCVICKSKVETTFLGKLRGTYFKGKVVCNNCQRKFKGRLKEQLE